MSVGFVDAHKDEHGVEPILSTLAGTPVGIAPSTYYAHKSRPASARQLSDLTAVALIASVHAENYGVYGARKVWHELHRQGHTGIARCTVERLMRANGLRGVPREKTVRTTIAARDALPEDKVNRNFTATAPNQLLVADLTYVRTHSGWVYAAFILDVYARRVVGWQVSTSLHTRLALDALDMAIWSRRREGADLSTLIHHSDKGVQYRAVRYTQRLADAEMVASVGSTGDSYDNAMAEAFNSLYKAELVRNRGPWAGISDLEIGTAEYIDWYNHRRLHGEIGYAPPA